VGFEITPKTFDERTITVTICIGKDEIAVLYA
jgi:hypothetical protein